MTVDFDLSNPMKGMRQLEAYKKNLSTRNAAFLLSLADIVVKEADIGFETAVYDGINDVSVYMKPNTSKGEITVYAEGNAVAFIEFGTGITFATPEHPKAEELGMKRGSYGYHQGKKSSWTYEGEEGTNGVIVEQFGGKKTIETQGNPANMPLYQAEQEARDNEVRLAKEAFGSDRH